MTKSLDEARSRELAQQIKSKSRAPFDNAYRGALAISGAMYIQGFLVIAGKRCKTVEHAWLELEECLLDPSFAMLNQHSENLYYFPAQKLSVKQLKAAIEEAKEDYPEDNPLPIYGSTPYEYYGDVMLGGREYQQAYQMAQEKCQELNKAQTRDRN